MSRNLLLVIGLLAALALFAALALNGDQGVLTEPEIARALELEESALRPEREAGDLPDRGLGPARESTAVEHPVSTESREEVVGLDPEEGFALRVQDAAGTPVAGATVWTIHEAGSKARRSFRDAGQIDALMEEQGSRRTSSPDGTLRLPRSDAGQTLVVARKGDLWGKLRVPNGDADEHVLTLQRDVRLRVQVLDVAAQPVAGVPVLIEQQLAAYSSTLVERETEGSEGIATFPHAQIDLKPGHSLGPDGTLQVDATTWLATAEVLSAEPVSAKLDHARLDELVVLSLPALGSVQVEVAGDDWKPFQGRAQAWLEAIPEGEPRQVSPFSHIRRRRLQREVKAGEATFEGVEVGLQLGVEVKRDNANTGTRAYGPGPRRAGATATLEVKLGSDHPVVRLRALESGGQPLTGVVLDCGLHLRSQFIQTANKLTPRTDEEGYFLVDLAKDWSEGATRLLTVAVLSGDDPEPTGTVDLSRELELGLNDLGDVVLEKAGVFVGGRVESQAGAPVAAADLSLRSRAENSVDWDQHWDFDFESDEAGSFLVEQPFAGVTFQLSAKKTGFASQWVDFEPGEQDLVIRLSTPGSIEGSALLDEGLPAERLHVRVEPLRDQAEYLDWESRQQSLDPQGAFRLEGLLPGLRTVTLGADNLAEDLMTFEDVLVQAGEACRDPRLARIDLRGKLFYHRLELIGGEAGGRLSGEVTFAAAGSEELDQRLWLTEGRARIFSRSERIDVVIAASGYRVERLFAHSGAATIQLWPGLVVTLVLTGEAEVPAPPVFVKAALVPAEGDRGAIDWSGGAFDERREIKARVSSGGRMKVRWILERRSSSSSIATGVDLDREQFVDVLDVDGEQRIEVDLTPEEMQQLVDNLP